MLINNQTYTKYIGAENFNHSVHISLKHKYVYVETPKVACSTIKTVLQKMELGDAYVYREDFEDIHRRELSPLLQPSQIGNFENLMQNKNFLKFCFVRNPYYRLLSVYLEKICGNKKEKKQILSELGYNSENIEKKISFEEFVHTIIAQPISSMNPHWRIQYHQTIQDSVKYDFVGKLENFDKDFTNALEKIGIQDYEKRLTSEKRHASNANEKIKKYYTEELRDLVYMKFQKDFEYFEYSPVLDEILSKKPNIKNNHLVKQVTKNIESNIVDSTVSADLEKIYQNVSKIASKSQPIYLLCVFRDEEILFDYFIKYYKSLGVTHFIMIDNLSEDGGVNYLKSVKGVNMTIYQAKGSYKDAYFGTEWINELLKKYCQDQYCFVVDVDELFYFDTGELKNIHQLIFDMESKNNNVVQATLLDMYPAVINNNYQKGDNFLEHSSFFDQYNTEYYTAISTKIELLRCSGGVRKRVFDKPVGIRKFPFFKYNFNPIGVATGCHDLQFDRKAVNDSDKISIYSKAVILLHFKFIKPDLKVFFERRVSLNEDWNDSTEYKAYATTLANNTFLKMFDKRYSVRFEGDISMNIFYKLQQFNYQLQKKNMELQQKNQQNQEKDNQIKQKEIELINLESSKSFRLGDLFFRSVKRPYKLITLPANCINILLKK